MLANSQDFYNELFDYAKNLPKINTHCHQLPDEELQGFDLDALLRNSYINWIGIPWNSSPDSRKSLLEKIRFNSFFVWFQKSLWELYDSDEPLSGLNWQAWQERIQAAYRDSLHSKKTLVDKCAYRRLILDAYWKPGSDNDTPDLMLSFLDIRQSPLIMMGTTLMFSTHMTSSSIWRSMLIGSVIPFFLIKLRVALHLSSQLLMTAV
jgi:hypothetical protein